MKEYETFVYLDTQKTGSAFVKKFLSKNTKEKLIKSKMHGRVFWHKKHKFYFITIRDPVSLYWSLFRYGLGKKGGVYERLTKAGFSDLYTDGLSGFQKWLRVMLSPESATYLKRGYDRSRSAHLIGFQSFRFLSMAVPLGIWNLKKCKSKEDLRSLYKKKNMAERIIKNENLNQELKELVQGPLQHAFSDPKQACEWLDQSEKLNTATGSSTEQDQYVTSEDKKLIKEREWFIYELGLY